jgi:hypothetical protein
MCYAAALGLYHGLFVLPVLLSWIKPSYIGPCVIAANVVVPNMGVNHQAQRVVADNDGP